ncbi:MAG: radical SAM family heme chaperone HemW [Thermodesulfovibrionales bacterium]
MAAFLYIHIPFCIRKCAYCDFPSQPYDSRLAGDYVRALCRELALRRDEAEELKTVFLGGGTPSMLPEASLCAVFSSIRENYRIARDAEITIEANPGTIGRSKLAALTGLGINRLSIGVQSFVDAELAVLGRAHSAEDARAAVECAGEAGFENISLDLMYGIPCQTRDSWLASLRQAVSLGPEHVSAYELTPEQRTPLCSDIGSGTLVLPQEDDVVRMSDDAIDLLEEHGYERYEISNYARPGFRCIHNLNYWERGEYLGIGAGAHSFIGSRRSHNTADIRQYVSLLEQAASAEAGSLDITGKEAARETLFLGLRKTEGIDLKQAGLLLPGLVPASADLIAQGLLGEDRGRLRFTREGMRVSNSVLVQLFENLGL